MDWNEWMREATAGARDGERDEALDDLVVLDVSSGSMAGVVCASVLRVRGRGSVSNHPAAT